jgi:hypothetical protein
MLGLFCLDYTLYWMSSQSYWMYLFFRMQEADSGFVLVIDRRNDKWHSVKTVLLKISVGVWKQYFFCSFCRTAVLYFVCVCCQSLRLHDIRLLDDIELKSMEYLLLWFNFRVYPEICLNSLMKSTGNSKVVTWPCRVMCHWDGNF